MGTTNPTFSAMQTPADPVAPLVNYNGFGMLVLKTAKRLQSQGVFDRRTVSPASALQKGVATFTAPKSLIGG
jgi:hypothetical protein